LQGERGGKNGGIYNKVPGKKGGITKKKGGVGKDKYEWSRGRREKKSGNCHDGGTQIRNVKEKGDSRGKGQVEGI